MTTTAARSGRRSAVLARLVTLLAFVPLVTLVGCASSSPYMTRSSADELLAASPGAATVVFLRPSSLASAITTTVLDTQGRFLGEVVQKSYFAVKVPAGEHVFLSWAENTAALRANVTAGKTYYVRVAPRLGAWSARMQLLAVKRASEDWPKLRGWLKDLKAFGPNQAEGQRYVDSRKEDVQKRVARANEILKEYDPKELEDRTLRPDDGE
jgi:hypothetical protein